MAQNEIQKTDGNPAYLQPQPWKEKGSNTALVAHVIQTLEIAKDVDPDDLNSLKHALWRYLQLCAETNTKVTNQALYNALGVNKSTISRWASGALKSRDPGYKEFALLVRRICAQFREQAGVEGLIHPNLVIWMQKNYDGLTDNPVPDQGDTQALKPPADPDEVAKKYKHLLDTDPAAKLERERERKSTTETLYESEEGDEE